MSMLGLNLTRVSKKSVMTDSDTPCFVMFKHLQIDTFVADIGLYLSCLFTEIKSSQTS